jgi:cytochrome c553
VSERILVVVVLIAAAIGACTKESTDDSSATPGSGAAPQSNKAAFEARRTFQTICATCHGPGGEGNGAAAASMNPKPRNYTDKTWQASVTDDDIKKIILLGGAAVGKSATMPAQPQLQNQPEVVDELVKLIRNFAK